jgi:hypothetical protein
MALWVGVGSAATEIIKSLELEPTRLQVGDSSTTMHQLHQFPKFLLVYTQITYNRYPQPIQITARFVHAILRISNLIDRGS